MKSRYLAIVIWLISAFSLLPHGASAASEQIPNLAISTILTKHDVLNVTENISYDFGSNAPHTITHQIPLTFQDDQGTQYSAKFHLLSSGATETGNSDVVTITLPAGSGTGVHHYMLRYTLGPVVLNGQTGDVFKFNATGLGWGVPVNHITLRLSSPAPAVMLTCYTGMAGITSSNCQSQGSGDTSTVTTDAVLPDESNLTIYCNFPSHTFSSYLSPIGQNTGWIVLVAVMLMLVAVVAYIAFLLARRRVAKIMSKEEKL